MLKKDPKKWYETQRKAREKAMKKRLSPEEITRKKKQQRDMMVRSLEKKKTSKAAKKAVTAPYFDFHEKNATGICENCGGRIPHWQRRMTQAHILPKRDDYGFPSVAGELDNHMELCVEGGCHDLYDRTWEDAAAMPVFEIAKERFKLFESRIAPEERSRIPVQFTT